MSPKKIALAHSASEDAHSLYRIMDANLNRCKEGLRVCEEVARFHLEDAALTQACGLLRHNLTKIFKQSRIKSMNLFSARQICSDPGKDSILGPRRNNLRNVFIANAQRAKESLRVLEECAKILDRSVSVKIQKLRFHFYDFEKKTIKKYPSLLDSR